SPLVPRLPGAVPPRAVPSADPVPPSLLPQGLPADAQDGGGARLAARHLVQHVTDVLALDLLERRPPVASRPQGGGLLEDVGWEGGGGYHLPRRVEGRPLDHRAQLPDVARPAVALEGVGRVAGDGAGGRALA